MTECDAEAASRENKLFKIAFDLAAEDEKWSRISVERLWGEKTAVKFEIRVINTPFFVRGIAYGDLIRVRPNRDRRELVFDSFTAESGHSAICILINEGDVREGIQRTIEDYGCSWELGRSDGPVHDRETRPISAGRRVVHCHVSEAHGVGCQHLRHAERLAQLRRRPRRPMRGVVHSRQIARRSRSATGLPRDRRCRR